MKQTFANVKANLIIIYMLMCSNIARLHETKQNKNYTLYNYICPYYY